ncbi:hypothetical protein Tco_0411288 [Tanacetum coccineum]
MYGNVPPILPPLETNTGNLASPNRIDPILVDNTNNITTTNVAQNVIDLIIAHEGPSDIRDTKIAALKLKLNAFKALEGEKVNGTFTRKWLSMNQTQRANNSIRNDRLVTLYGKYNYKEATLMLKKIQGAAVKFLVDLHAAFHERAILANQKRFYKRSRRIGSAKKSMDKSNETYFAYGKLGLKAKMVVLTKKIDALSKGKSEKGLVAESFDCKVTLDQLLTKQVPGNIVPALGGRGKRKKTISSKEVVFTKADDLHLRLALRLP